MKSILVILIIVNIWCVLGGTVHNHEHEEKKYLSSNAVSEGKCKCAYATPHLNYTFAELPKTLYVPMASAHAYRLYAEILLARSAKCYQELEEMCLLQMMANGVRTTSGYGRMFSTTAVFSEDKFGVMQALPIYGTTGTWMNLDSNTGSVFQMSTGTVVLAHYEYDGDDFYYLVVRCINGNEADWEVVSSTPKISDHAAAKITKKIVELGFSKEYAMRLPCHPHGDKSTTAEALTAAAEVAPVVLAIAPAATSVL